MKAELILENGMRFDGEAFGYLDSKVGEVVFNTGMTGYQEILSDPSYYGQVVVMTFPLIGNYGINFDDFESSSPKVSGFVVREKCHESSNFRAEMELDNYLRHHKIIGIEGVDTRALTRVIRKNGTMKGVITTLVLTDEEALKHMNTLDLSDSVYKVTTKEAYELSGGSKRVAVMDYGVKKSILDQFVERGSHVKVFPAGASAEEVMAFNPELVFLSNGPGNPSDLSEIVGEIRKMIGEVPITGICLGHQLLAIALGGRTERLKFGHRGCNHPVRAVNTGKVTITSQNHGYHISELPEYVEATHISMNDGTVEGMRHTLLPIFSVQFHPEASPGPWDNYHLFDHFLAYAN